MALDSSALPPFAWKLRRSFQAKIAHAFLVAGPGVRDFVLVDKKPVGRVVPFLVQLLAKREVVAVYDRADGIQFPRLADRKRFVEATGFAPATQDPAIAAALGLPPQGEAELPTSPAEALPLLGRLLASQTRAAVIIDYADSIFPAADLSTMPPGDKTALIEAVKWGTDETIQNAGGGGGNIVIIVCDSIAALHPMIRSAAGGWQLHELPIPATGDRLAYIQWYKAEALEPDSLSSQPSIREMAATTAGLLLVHIEAIFKRAMVEGELTLDMVREQKKDIIAAEYGDVIEVMEPEFGFNAIGGLEHVKTFFEKSVVRPMRGGDTARVPMGVLLTGPAGTGKSVMAQAIAFEAGVNAVQLRIGGQIASMWQGQGERNLKKALEAIESLSPTIVFIDEVDQAMSRGGGGGTNQQDARIFQMLMEFMADTSHRGKIVFLAATNRPDRMDAALRRPGRFDKKIPFLPPTADERAAIIGILARKYMQVNPFIPASVLDATEGWTGAELEGLVVKASEIAYDENLEAAPAIAEALKRVRPTTADIEFMTNIALAECNDTDLLPPAYRARLENRKALEAEIEATKASAKKRPQERDL